MPIASSSSTTPAPNTTTSNRLCPTAHHVREDPALHRVVRRRCRRYVLEVHPVLLCLLRLVHLHHLVPQLQEGRGHARPPRRAGRKSATLLKRRRPLLTAAAGIPHPPVVGGQCPARQDGLDHRLARRHGPYRGAQGRRAGKSSRPREVPVLILAVQVHLLDRARRRWR